MKAHKIQGSDAEYRSFFCPGCKSPHTIPVTGPRAWGFNQNDEKPTFTPSVLCRWSYGPEKTQKVCHSFVTDGRIQFLGDCTHELKNQTVDLADFPDDWK